MLKQKIANKKLDITQTINLHLDIYPADTNLNFLLFEILFLKYINDNNKELMKIHNTLNFCIEIANTLSEKLYNSLLIL